MKLTDPHRPSAGRAAVLRHRAPGALEGARQLGPRADVRGRLGALGLLSFRTAWVHTGTTYRSRQRLAVVDVHVTDAGRQLLAAHHTEGE
jgi:hypothetical protein